MEYTPEQLAERFNAYDSGKGWQGFNTWQARDEEINCVPDWAGLCDSEAGWYGLRILDAKAIVAGWDAMAQLAELRQETPVLAIDGVEAIVKRLISCKHEPPATCWPDKDRHDLPCPAYYRPAVAAAITAAVEREHAVAVRLRAQINSAKGEYERLETEVKDAWDAIYPNYAGEDDLVHFIEMDKRRIKSLKAEVGRLTAEQLEAVEATNGFLDQIRHLEAVVRSRDKTEAEYVALIDRQDREHVELQTRFATSWGANEILLRKERQLKSTLLETQTQMDRIPNLEYGCAEGERRAETLRMLADKLGVEWRGGRDDLKLLTGITALKASGSHSFEDWMHREDYGDVEQLRRAFEAGQRASGGWRPIESAPKNKTPILRPHVNYGPMAVIYVPEGYRTEFGVWHWASSSYTPAWPDDAFLPYWMLLPDPPQEKP